MHMYNMEDGNRAMQDLVHRLRLGVTSDSTITK